ncbi:MAG: GDSL-type esterase/lipase family protein [Phycisphaerae bacterium]
MVRLIVFASVAVMAGGASAADPLLIDDMEAVRHKPVVVTLKDKSKAPAGTAEVVEGRVGRAVKFTFTAGVSGAFMAGAARATGEWDKAAGFSFWVKGDGSATWGGIELIDKSDFKLRYGYCFPIDSTEWRKVTVAWGDLMPELNGPVVDTKAAGAYRPSGFGSWWFGKFYYWREYPNQSFTVDEIRLEERIDRPAVPETPAGLSRVREKIRAGTPVTLVTMGDSLSDARHWANRKVVWSGLLAQAIEQKYKSKVTVVNPAIGGTALSQNVVLIPRWVKDAPTPDLVTILFGGNDWDNGVRGERFGQYLRVAVEQVRRQTGGSADVLILSTCPAHARWETYKELEDAARAVAAEMKCGYGDVAGEFRKAAGTADRGLAEKYWEWDKVHLGPRGHEVVRDVVMGAVER